MAHTFNTRRLTVRLAEEGDYGENYIVLSRSTRRMFLEVENAELQNRVIKEMVTGLLNYLDDFEDVYTTSYLSSFQQGNYDRRDTDEEIIITLY